MPETGLALEPTSDTIARHEEDLELENEEAENVIPGNQEIDTVGSINEDAALDPEKIRLEEAATKAQAAFRGYLVYNSVLLNTLLIKNTSLMKLYVSFSFKTKLNCKYEKYVLICTAKE